MGTAAWTAPITPEPGTNVFEVFAQDAAGNRSLTNAVNFLHGRPPMAAMTHLNTTQNSPVSLAATDLLKLCSDPDDDPLSLVSVASSSNGAPVSVVGDQITYVPLTNFVGADRFGYTISDGQGGTAVGEVQVDVYAGSRPFLSMVGAQKSAHGLRLRFSGIPGRGYRVEWASQVTGSWSILTNIVAGPGGLTDCEDDNMPPGQGFYRVLWEQKFRRARK